VRTPRRAALRIPVLRTSVTWDYVVGSDDAGESG